MMIHRIACIASPMCCSLSPSSIVNRQIPQSPFTTHHAPLIVRASHDSRLTAYGSRLMAHAPGSWLMVGGHVILLLFILLLLLILRGGASGLHGIVTCHRKISGQYWACPSLAHHWFLSSPAVISGRLLKGASRGRRCHT